MKAYLPSNKIEVRTEPHTYSNYSFFRVINSNGDYLKNTELKYYGGGCGQTLDRPLDTITTKDRFGLVNVILDIKGEKYIISDIFLRMLKPEELKLMQGFPKDYIIDRDYNWKKYPIAKQVARIGNSVVPIMAEKLVEANCPYLKVGERMPNMSIDDTQEQLRFA